MIEKVECYKAECDACGDPLTVDGEIQVHFDTISEIKSHMDTCEWGTLEGQDYCPGCWDDVHWRDDE
jgi:hypothetical protein